MKKAIVVVVILSLIGVSFAFRDNTPKYENLKVLPKNTTKQQMDSIMHHFSLSLGVRCNFCHARNNDEQKTFNFASDEIKNKLVARSMFKMMVKINKKYFKDADKDNVNMLPEVSCYSCHHGKEHPENKPPAPAPRGPEAGPGGPGGPDHKP